MPDLLISSQVVGIDLSTVLEGQEDLPLTSPLINCTDIRGTDCYLDPKAGEEIRRRIKNLPAGGIHLIDSGNYHYLTLFWLEKVVKEAFDLILIDNHPDTKEPVFGPITSCGGWVREALSTFPALTRVLMLGVDPALLMEEDLLSADKDMKKDPGDPGPLKRVICDPVNTRESQLDLLDRFLGGSSRPVYLSIDKDCLNKEEARTSWSQGQMRLSDLTSLTDRIRESGRLLGADLSGEVSDPSDTGGNRLNERANLALISHLLPPASSSSGPSF